MSSVTKSSRKTKETQSAKPADLTAVEPASAYEPSANERAVLQRFESRQERMSAPRLKVRKRNGLGGPDGEILCDGVHNARPRAGCRSVQIHRHAAVRRGVAREIRQSSRAAGDPVQGPDRAAGRGCEQ